MTTRREPETMNSPLFEQQLTKRRLHHVVFLQDGNAFRIHPSSSVDAFVCFNLINAEFVQDDVLFDPVEIEHVVVVREIVSPHALDTPLSTVQPCECHADMIFVDSMI